MKPSEVLAQAQVEIMERGWGQGFYKHPNTGVVCARGAIHYALPLGGNVRALSRASEMLRKFLYQHFGESQPLGEVSITSWNDQPDRTEAQVLGALHEAEILAKEAEDEAE